MIKEIAGRLPGLHHVKRLFDRVASQVQNLNSRLYKNEALTATLCAQTAPLDARFAKLEAQLHKSYHLLEHRADQIHRNVVQALASQGDSALTFSTFLGQNPAPSSLRDALLFERASMYRAGTYTLSPGDTRFTPPANEGETRYLATHLKRYEVTLDLLAAIGHRKGNVSVIADLSTSHLYHPGLFAQFPTTRFIFTGHGNNADQPSTSADRVQWITGQNLETHPLPLPDESVDIVMLLEVLEHFEIDPLFALAEINRVLKPGGILFLSTPNLASWLSLTSVLTGQSPMLYSKYSLSHGGMHIKEWVPKEIEILFRAAGFDPQVTTQNVYYYATPSTIKQLLHLTGIPNSLEGDTIFATGTKTGPVINRHPLEFYGE